MFRLIVSLFYVCCTAAYFTHLASIGDSISAGAHAKGGLSSGSCLYTLNYFLTFTPVSSPELNFVSNIDNGGIPVDDQHCTDGLSASDAMADPVLSLVERHNCLARSMGTPTVPINNIIRAAVYGNTITDHVVPQAEAVAAWINSTAFSAQSRLMVVIVLGVNDACDPDERSATSTNECADAYQSQTAVSSGDLDTTSYCRPTQQLLKRQMTRAVELIRKAARAQQNLDEVFYVFLPPPRMSLVCELAASVKPLFPVRLIGRTCENVYKATRSKLIPFSACPSMTADDEGGCSTQAKESIDKYLLDTVGGVIRDTVDSINAMNSTGTKLGAVYIENAALMAPMGEDRENFLSPCDCFHPTEDAHARLAEAAWSTWDCSDQGVTCCQENDRGNCTAVAADDRVHSGLKDIIIQKVKDLSEDDNRTASPTPRTEQPVGSIWSRFWHWFRGMPSGVALDDTDHE